MNEFCLNVAPHKTEATVLNILTNPTEKLNTGLDHLTVKTASTPLCFKFTTS